MMFKSFIFCASVALVQLTNGQCLNNYISQPQIVTTNSCGKNLVSSINQPQIISTQGSYGNNLLSTGELLNIASGSFNTPGGISINTDNLEVTGTVGVSGYLPFMGTVAMSGGLPVSGSATVNYGAGGPIAITSAGCGQGLSIVAPGTIQGNNLQMQYGTC